MKTSTLFFALALLALGCARDDRTGKPSVTQPDVNLAYRCGQSASVVTAVAAQFPKDKQARSRVVAGIASRSAGAKLDSPLVPTPVELSSSFASVEMMLEMKNVDVSDPEDRNTIVGTAAALCALASSLERKRS